MKLKSFGCSFVFGTDLGDEQSSADAPIQASKKTWPALLSNHLGCDYECHARPGAGNLQILEKVLNSSAPDSDDVIVINWTWLDRFDYYDSNFQGAIWTDWHTIQPCQEDRVSRFYYKHLHSEYGDKLNSLIYAKTALDHLKAGKNKFVMTYMDSLMFDQTWHVSPAVKYLQDYVRPYMTTFDGLPFLDWCKRHAYAVSESWHPLDQAHQQAADYMIKVVDRQKIIGPAQQAHV